MNGVNPQGFGSSYGVGCRQFDGSEPQFATGGALLPLRAGWVAAGFGAGGETFDRHRQQAIDGTRTPGGKQFLPLLVAARQHPIMPCLQDQINAWALALLIKQREHLRFPSTRVLPPTPHTAAPISSNASNPRAVFRR